MGQVGVVAFQDTSTVVPWRDAGLIGVGTPFAIEGYTPADGEGYPYARFRNVTPGFFAALGVPLLAGRDFNEDDRAGREPVVIVSQSLAQRFFPNGEAVGGPLWWTDPYFGPKRPGRIVGVVADADDESVVPGPARTVYQPFRQLPYGALLFVHTSGDPYALVEPVTRTIRALSPEQPIERPATLADIRAQVLAPERLNAFVLSGFASVALLIAVAGSSPSSPGATDPEQSSPPTQTGRSEQYHLCSRSAPGRGGESSKTRPSLPMPVGIISSWFQIIGLEQLRRLNWVLPSRPPAKVIRTCKAMSTIKVTQRKGRTQRLIM